MIKKNVTNLHEFDFNLCKYGWNNKLDQLKLGLGFQSLPHGRIAAVHKTCYDVVSDNGILRCELTGNMLYAKSEYELPCTGDWVIFQQFEENRGIIIDMLPRERVLERKRNGSLADRQALASYIDKAFIVQSLDVNFNIRRAERFMIQIIEADIQPVLVLNKADLTFDQERVKSAVRHLQQRMPMFMTSIYQPHTIAHLREYISEGETIVVVGSSGVGKSSLVNTLCGKAALLTSEISKSTGKGRHTSTRREMVEMEGGGILVDTPGVREFGLTIDNREALTNALELSDYAGICRFKDCTHLNEPGCAVLEAVDNGSLDPKIYQSFLKLEREINHFTASEHEKRKKKRALSKLVNEVKKQQGLR